MVFSRSQKYSIIFVFPFIKHFIFSYFYRHTFFMSDFETIEPVWKFQAEADPIVEVTSFQLLLWPEGVTIVGYSGEGHAIDVRTFLFLKRWDIDFLEYLINNDAAFAGPQPIRKIWLADERNLLIPANLAGDDHSESWFRKFHFLEAEEQLTHLNMSPHLEADLTFPIHDKLRELLEKYLPEARINALSYYALAELDPSTAPVLRILSLPKFVFFTLQQNGKFLLHQLYPYEQADNIVYKIALLLQEKDIPQDHIGISLQGIAPFWHNLHTELPAFFPEMNAIPDTTATSLTFLNNLYQCE